MVEKLLLILWMLNSISISKSLTLTFKCKVTHVAAYTSCTKESKCESTYIGVHRHTYLHNVYMLYALGATQTICTCLSLI